MIKLDSYWQDINPEIYQSLPINDDSIRRVTRMMYMLMDRPIIYRRLPNDKKR